MLTVVGGAYREICLHPQWDQLFGSGVRAAAAVADLSRTGGVQLHTWVAPRDKDDIRLRAASYGFSVELEQRKDLIEFQYDHALSPPRLYPDRCDLSLINGTKISAENAVCFSLIEGDFQVQAKKLVFDPQAGKRARTPRASGHSASTIAIVANVSEVRAMLEPGSTKHQQGEQTPAALGKALLQQEQCSVVVVKNAANGATVVTPIGVERVPSYFTERVFPIGSGDVFTGVFAHYWLVEGLDPVDAARLASGGTARYCGSRVLPVPSSLRDALKTMEEAPSAGPPGRVYLAGPLFTLPQVWLLNETKRALEGQGLVVFSPKDEVGYLPNLESAPKVAKEDLKGLDASDVVFAILDGLDPGTIFEVGYACKNKPVIGFAENTSPHALTMLLGTGCRVYEDYSTAVYQTAWTARKR